MKKTLLLSLCFSSLLLGACNTKSKKDKVKTDSLAVNTNTKDADKTITDQHSDTAKVVPIDISKIPVTTKDLGTFPYINAPENYNYHDILKSDMQTLHFPVDGRLTSVEGKTFRSNIYKNSESDSPFNLTIVDKYYHKIITESGGVQVSSKLLPGEVEKAGLKVLDQEGAHAYSIIGANEFTLNNVRTYLIRTAKSEIWIELSFYENGGYIAILEK